MSLSSTPSDPWHLWPWHWRSRGHMWEMTLGWCHVTCWVSVSIWGEADGRSVGVNWWILHVWWSSLAMKAEFYHRDNLSMMRIFHECYFHITAPLCREAASKATSPHSQTVLWSWDVLSPYHWAHCISNHWQLNCLFNSLFRGTTKKTSKFYMTCHLWGESADHYGFSAQRASDAESGSMSLCHHVHLK